jgi:hypothetical protein
MKVDELIEERIKKVEDGFNDLRNSIDFAHAEVVDLKEDNKVQKIKGEEIRAKIEKLEQENTALNGNSVIDLKARSMRDNLIFCNIEETERENTTEKLHGLLEEKMGFKDAAMKIQGRSYDLSHRIGRARRDGKPLHDLSWLNLTGIKTSSRLDLMQENSREVISEFRNSIQRTLMLQGKNCTLCTRKQGGMK